MTRKSIKNNIIISGATSYLGRRLIKKIKNNSFNFFYLSRKENSANSFTISKLDKIKLNDVYCFIHLATNYNNSRNKESFHINYEIPRKILKKYKKKLVYFINFDTVLNKNVNYYSFTKKKLKKESKKICLENNINFLNFRIHYLYGPKIQKKNFIRLIADSLKNKVSLNLTDCTQKRDFIFIDDAVYLISEIIKINILNKKKFKYLDIEIGSGKSYSLKKIINLITHNLKIKNTFNFGILKKRSFENKNLCSKNIYIKKYFNHKFINIKEGIKRTIN